MKLKNRNSSKSIIIHLASLLIGLTLTTSGQTLPAIKIAGKHAITVNKPAPDFFEGALLGNGGMGVVVTTRPDAIVMYFGHNNVWDIRIAENHKDEIGTFKMVFDKISKIPADLKNLTDDPWYRDYNRLTSDNYSKPYPRPFPCGSMVLGFDRRKVRLLGHKLDIANGLCEVMLLNEHNQKLCLKLFTDLTKDNLLLSLTGVDGRPANNVFDRVKISPDPSTPGEFPKYESWTNLANGTLAFRQILPASESKISTIKTDHANDKAFTLTARLNTALTKSSRKNWNGNIEQMAVLEAALAYGHPFSATVSLNNGLASEIVLPSETSLDNLPPFNTLLTQNTALWEAYWSKSAVKLNDPFLERIWYRNIYFMNCAINPSASCPGIFGNWSYNNIGTAWHGDYHMNYNTQQPFWATFSSNHIDKNLAYVNLIEALMPVSKKWAHDYYELPGAYFPHSAYPVTMTMNPYPVPDWGWEVSETPWAVQGLWWHYLYTGDEAFLKARAFMPIKAAVEFLNAYMRRPDARNRWKDNNYHVFPTIPPELYGLQPGFRFNYDCTVDLSLIKFIFNAYAKAVHKLNYERQEHELLTQVTDILAHLPAYATTQSANYGTVLVSVPGETDQVVYNVPNALFPVFPGEDVALMNDPAGALLLENTLRNQRNEGGNDLVMMNLQSARIGKLDLEQFKNQVLYCLMPNGTATDMVTQTNGRYDDRSDFTYMSRMGIWVENFALPAVINECLMQSYSGTIRLFPNWHKDAAFSTLRAAGAFLVSAAQKNGKVQTVTIVSEKGQVLKLENPWKNRIVKVKSSYGLKQFKGNIITLQTEVGEKLVFYPL